MTIRQTCQPFELSARLDDGGRLYRGVRAALTHKTPRLRIVTTMAATDISAATGRVLAHVLDLGTIDVSGDADGTVITVSLCQTVLDLSDVWRDALTRWMTVESAYLPGSTDPRWLDLSRLTWDAVPMLNEGDAAA